MDEIKELKKLIANLANDIANFNIRITELEAKLKKLDRKATYNYFHGAGIL